jgi:peptidyl-tRNA hydrolase
MAVGSTSGKISVKVKKKPKVFVNQSGLVVRRLSDLGDVDLSTNEDGSLLIYDETQEKFVASRLLDKQEINGGHF